MDAYMTISEQRAPTRNKLKVSTRLIGGFAVLTILAVGIGGIGWYSVRSIDTELNNISGVAAPTVEMIDDLIAGVWQRAIRLAIAHTVWGL